MKTTASLRSYLAVVLFFQLSFCDKRIFAPARPASTGYGRGPARPSSISYGRRPSSSLNYGRPMTSRGYGRPSPSNFGGYNMVVEPMTSKRVNIPLITQIGHVPNCFDHPAIASQCPFWAMKGQCESNRHFMLRACRYSCGICAGLSRIPPPCGTGPPGGTGTFVPTLVQIPSFNNVALQAPELPVYNRAPINNPPYGVPMNRFPIQKYDIPGPQIVTQKPVFPKVLQPVVKYGANTGSYGPAAGSVPAGEYPQSPGQNRNNQNQNGGYGSSSKPAGYGPVQPPRNIQKQSQSYRRVKRQAIPPGTQGCLEDIENQILFGGNRAMFRTADKQACIDLCLETFEEYDCKAVVFYQNRQECLLYDFNGNERPDRVLAVQPPEQSNLVNIICDRGNLPTAAPTAQTGVPTAGPLPPTAAPAVQQCKMDMNINCQYWADQAQCTLNPLWMLQFCPNACFVSEIAIVATPAPVTAGPATIGPPTTFNPNI